MSNLTFNIPELRKHGPGVEIVLSVKQAPRAPGSPEPEGIPLKAIFDTGARRTIVQLGLAERLGVEPIGNRSVSTASARSHPCFVYDLRIAIPTMHLVFEGPILEMPLEGQNVQCLVGRDILANGVLIYNGPANAFTFAV